MSHALLFCPAVHMKTQTHIPFLGVAPLILFCYVPISYRVAINQSQSCGKWKLSEYSWGAQGELCAPWAPFHLLCLRLHAELLHDLSLLSRSHNENEVEISSGDICVCESACVSIAESWPYTQEHEQTHTCTHTDVHRSSISIQS